MFSFKDESSGNDIAFDNIKELYVDVIRDVVSSEITGYYVEYNNQHFNISEDTYNALINM